MRIENCWSFPYPCTVPNILNLSFFYCVRILKCLFWYTISLVHITLYLRSSINKQKFFWDFIFHVFATMQWVEEICEAAPLLVLYQTYSFSKVFFILILFVYLTNHIPFPFLVFCNGSVWDWAGRRSSWREPGGKVVWVFIQSGQAS